MKTTKPKNDIGMDISLNSEQEEAKKIILENDIVVLFGKAGSGKTLVAVETALSELFYKNTRTIHITRPTISNERLGFLPGNIKEKMDPWLLPIYENLRTCYGSDDRKRKTIQNLIDNETIRISPISFMRGITYKNSYIIADECQNITRDQMEMLITRLGQGSKMILCGDIKQVDLLNKEESGLQYLIDCGKNIKGFSVFELKQNHRHQIVDDFVKIFEKNKKKTRKTSKNQ